MLLPVGFLDSSVSGGEILVILAVALVLFGPKRLPEMARTLGRAIERLRSASRDFIDQVMNIADETDRPDIRRTLPGSLPSADTAGSDGGAIDRAMEAGEKSSSPEPRETGAENDRASREA